MNYTAPAGNAVSLPLGGAGIYTAPAGASVALPFGDETPHGAVADSYTVVGDTVLSVAAPGVLGNDTLAGGAIASHTDPAHGALTLNADGSFVYTPSLGYIGADSFTYTLTSAGGSSSATVSISVTALPVRRYIGLSVGGAYATPPRAAAACTGTWEAPQRRTLSAAMAFAMVPRCAVDFSARWKVSPRVALDTRAGWAQAPRKASEIAALWRAIPRVIAGTSSGWTMPLRRSRETLAPFAAPPRRVCETTAVNVMPPPRRRETAIAFLSPPRRLSRVWVPFGTAPRVAWRPTSPGIDVPPPIVVPPVYVPPDGAHVALPLECLWYADPGDKIALPIGPFACYAASLGRRRYIVLNSAAVVRLPERTPIAVSAISLNASVDSVAWSVSITLADPALRAYLVPDVNGPKSIEININGYVWTAIIEAWQTQSKFLGDVVTMTGHSRTMLLTAPYRTPRDYAQNVDRNAQQLAADELLYSGFTLDYGSVDWPVPGGVWTYQQQTPMSAISALAAAAGAVVQSHPYLDTVQIRPRWPVSLWEWSATAPDKIVPDDVTPQLTASDQATRHAIYKIDGLPLWPATATDMPGLILPLQLVQFVAAAQWTAQASAVTIAAQIAQSGQSKALVVTQAITLDAPPSEPVYDSVLVSGQHVGVSAPIIRTGRAGTTRLPQIVDALITASTVQRERGRIAIASGGDGVSRTNVWLALTGILPADRLIKGNVTALNADGSITVATSDGGIIRPRPMAGQTWAINQGVLVRGAYIVDAAPDLPGTTQYV